MKETREQRVRVGLCGLLLLTAGCGALPMRKRIGGERFYVQRIFREKFDTMNEWANLTPATVWWVEKGKLYGHWAPGGSTLWCRRDFESDLYLEFTARLLPPDKAWVSDKMPEGGKNINLRFLVTGPTGEDILTVYRKLAEEGTGPNRIGDDQYRGYFFTWTYSHARLRRSPGYEKVSENREVLPDLNRPYRISVLARDGRIKYWVDGRLMHDYQDDFAFDEGKMGFALYKSNVEISDLRVYRVLR
ncbi:MAG: hypothetical protein GXP25_01170 [Planctomycetes bacterium]|nr:hypothetical protein [Planctomycetota bacterium]